MASLSQLTVHEAGERLDRGDLTSLELVRAVLAAIERIDPHVRAYLSVDGDDALAQARAADGARKKGARSPLLGIPIAVKDALSVRGQPCTCASRILSGYRAPYDATVVTRLREQGAIVLGRTNMDEFAMGSTTRSSAFQQTRNPWDLERIPGGSSGGSAAAVTGGEALAALGSDTGGSVRQPAALCGCVGLKPSYGRVSRYGLTTFASSFDQVGPLTRDVRDAALLLGALAGHDPLDSTSLEAPVPEYTATLQGDLKGLRLGLPREYFTEGLSPDIKVAVHAAAEQCRALGAEIVEVSLPQTSYALAAFHILATAEASSNLARFDGVRYGARAEADEIGEMYTLTRTQGLGDEVKRRILLGTYVLSHGFYDAYYLHAQKVRTLIRNDFLKAFETCDALLTPTTPTAAYRLTDKIDDPLALYLDDVFSVTANLAGMCGLSIPCGMTADRLPIGLQILGPSLGEPTILRVGYAYEQATSWHRERPPLWDLLD